MVILGREKEVIFRMIIYFTIILVIFLILNPLSSKALDLAVTLSTEQTIYQNTFNLSIAIGNPSEECVYKIEAIFFFPEGFSSDDKIVVEKLESNSFFKEIISVFINETKLPGIYPIVTLFKYQNINNVSFSKLFNHLIAYKINYSPSISGYVSYLEIERGEEKETSISITNLDNKPHDISVTLFLPDELDSTFYKEIITLDSLSKYEFNIPIHASDKISENDYLAIASLEYEEEGIHYSTFAQGIIRVTKGKEIPLLIWILLLIFTSLLIFYIYVKIKGKK